MPTDETTAPAAVVDTSVAATPAAPPAATEDPAWLPMRLARKEKELLKTLGGESIEDLKARLAEAAALKASQLSEAEKTQARIASLEATAAEAAELRSAIASQAEDALASLTEAQRAAVVGIAGDSPAKQLRAITALRPTWVAVVPPTATPKPVAVAASTTPAATAPPPAASATENVLATYEALAKSNPVAAAHYRLNHLNAYYDALKARQ